MLRAPIAPTVHDAPPPVPVEEFAARRARTREAIAAAGLDGLLAWGSVNWSWAARWLADHQSGFAAAAPFGDKGFSALVLPVDGEPILVLDQRVPPSDLNVADARTVESVTAGVAAALRDAGLAGKRVGIAGEGAFLDRQRRAIEAALGAADPVTWAPADRIVEPLHRVKSPAELELLRHASRVGAAWIGAMVEAAEPGRTEADLVAIGLPVLLAGGGFPDDVVIGSGLPCRPNAPRGIPSFDARRPLAAGDLIRVDGFGPVLGYYCDLARSASVGQPATDAQAEVLQQAVDLIDHLIATVRPGVTHAQVHDAGTAFLTERGHPPHGYFEGFVPMFGHQLGLTTEGPFVAAGSTAPIEVGQVLALEIVMGTPESGGISHEEAIIVHEHHNEVLTASCPARWW
ncbi:M24 family metallopeptidase [Patulibacter defluvii]|uniref:M24 family metallopeptidase n=1 Tax=Patulibacter defluvii TaxID=3095358 RepID=UPI002A74DFC9|nr:M24 family metallopeptidase [Patulibacter sp. DM4]